MNRETVQNELNKLNEKSFNLLKDWITNFKILYSDSFEYISNIIQELEDEIKNRSRKLSNLSRQISIDEDEFYKEKLRNEDRFLIEKDSVEIKFGDKIYSINRKILCAIKGSRLERMFSGRFNEMILQGNGYYHLDVDPYTFLKYVLVFLANNIDTKQDVNKFLKDIKDEEGRIRHEFLLLGLINNRLKFENLKITKKNKIHSDQITCLTVINNFIVSGPWDKSIKICDISTLDCIRTIERAHLNWVLSLTSWNDSLVSCSFDQTIKIWNLSNGSCIRTLTGHSSWVNCVIVFNDQIVSGSDDKTIKIWNPNNGNCLQTLTGHTDAVLCLGILNNDTIVSGSVDDSIKIWNVSSSTCISTLTGHSGTVRSLIVLNDLIISGSWDNTIKIWSPLTGNCISTLTDHSGYVHGLCVVDEQHFISCSWDKTLKIWNISSNECVRTLHSSDEVWCVTFHENQIICGLRNGPIEIWEEIKS